MIYNEQTKIICDPLLAKGFHDLDFDEYKAADAANASGLKAIRRSPAHYQYFKANPKKTDAKDFGSLLHTLVLEPEWLERRAKRKKKVDGRTKEGKAYNEAFNAELEPGVLAVDEVEFDNLLRARDNLMKNSWTKRVMGKGKNEQSAFFLETVDDKKIFCKSRIDKICNGWTIEVKTAANASKHRFNNDIIKFGYDIQAYMQRRAFEESEKCSPEGHMWLCVESDEVFGVAIYTAEPRIIEHGCWKAQKALMTYAECYESGVWPCYEEKPVALDLPAWAVYEEE